MPEVRQIILDTETTGLDPALGHRIIEIGGVEIVNRQPTGKQFHRYVNPERDSDEGALQVHGITTEFLQDKPKFREIAREFLDYVKGAELVIHNAAFDIAFLNHELRLLDLQPVTTVCAAVIDSLKQARELHPGKRNSLDALCERYQIDNTGRTLHGALLDAQLLAEVYLAMTRGQDSLLIDAEPAAVAQAEEAAREKFDIIVLRASDEEIAAHEAQLADIDKASGGKCLWKNIR
ncbi:MAG: DNA polymerase III subunit epsilon [Betaproteobacteria bacterium]|nr:DNA polymerase III subunit epsilon [Betaproteobacteria bacterium]